MRLNIGCADVQPAGWVNLDPDERWGRIWLGYADDPLSPLSLPTFDDGGNVEGVVAHHVLQAVAWVDLVPWLSEVRRVLAPDAWLRLSVPDFPRAYAAALDGNRDWFPIEDDHERSIDGKLCLYLTQGGASRSIFTGPWLRDLCRRAGFGRARIARFGVTSGPEWLTELDSREHESIYVEAQR